MSTTCVSRTMLSTCYSTKSLGNAAGSRLRAHFTPPPWHTQSPPPAAAPFIGRCSGAPSAASSTGHCQQQALSTRPTTVSVRSPPIALCACLYVRAMYVRAVYVLCMYTSSSHYAGAAVNYAADAHSCHSRVASSSASQRALGTQRL